VFKGVQLGELVLKEVEEVSERLLWLEGELMLRERTGCKVVEEVFSCGF
jgi:hypothetical protein